MDSSEVDNGFRDRPIQRRARSPIAKERVREALVSAGRELFATHRYEEVSLRMIAKRAGFAPSGVYKHFKDRASLFIAIREAELEDVVSQLKAWVGKPMDPRARIFAITELAIAWEESTTRMFGLNMVYGTVVGQDHLAQEKIDTSGMSQDIMRAYGRAVASYLDDQPGTRVDTRTAVNEWFAVISGASMLPRTLLDSPLLEARLAIGRNLVSALLKAWSER